MFLSCVALLLCTNDISRSTLSFHCFCRDYSDGLCAYANCTVNPDRRTASCGCYSLPNPTVTRVRVDLIPSSFHSETVNKCNESNVDCTEIGTAPICDTIANNQLWPTADLTSTFSFNFQEENGVKVFPENGTRVPTPNWQCSASTETLVALCMLAPCRYNDKDGSNPYNHGTYNMTCTCPLASATADYAVFGGLQDPCSTDPTNPGDTTVAVGRDIVNAYVQNESQIEEGWKAVLDAFEEKNGDTNRCPDGNGDDTSSSQDNDSSGGNINSGMVLFGAVGIVTAFMYFVN